MKYIVALISATALAALSSVVCSYFANDPTKGITTGFSQGELKIIPWIVFIITLVALSKGKRSEKLAQSQSQSDLAKQSSVETTQFGTKKEG